MSHHNKFSHESQDARRRDEQARAHPEEKSRDTKISKDMDKTTKRKDKKK